jgi:hypothetical protein
LRDIDKERKSGVKEVLSVKRTVKGIMMKRESRKE